MTSSDTAKVVESMVNGVDGTIDVVVNNAGYSLLDSSEDMSEAEIEI